MRRSAPYKRRQNRFIVADYTVGAILHQPPHPPLRSSIETAARTPLPRWKKTDPWFSSASEDEGAN
jgi:hypothetical protein